MKALKRLLKVVNILFLLSSAGFAIAGVYNLYDITYKCEKRELTEMANEKYQREQEWSRDPSLEAVSRSLLTRQDTDPQYRVSIYCSNSDVYLCFEIAFSIVFFIHLIAASGNYIFAGSFRLPKFLYGRVE